MKHRYLLTLFTAACAGGALGQSRLEDSTKPRGMDGPIAVGAWLSPRIDLELAGSGAPAMSMRSARPDVLEAKDDRLVGVAPGVSAVLITTDDGTVLDFVHLWVVAPTRVELEVLDSERNRRGGIDDTIELLVGESLYLAPVVYAGTQELAGTAAAEWHADAGIVDLLKDGEPSRRRIVARAPGKTTVAVKMLGMESSFDLVVAR